MIRAVLLCCLWAAPLAADGHVPNADVLFLGEQHDNPAHHARQAEIVRQVRPTALVFEMLTPEQAARISADLIVNETALEAALQWEEGGWPDFSMYYGIFAAAPDAAYFGAAIPRDDARRVMTEGIADVFGDAAALFGLTVPLPSDQQETREALQLSAHCDAMPPEMLPIMVDIQRLRDAALARAALRAFHEAGTPVVVITGNGHARQDWGAPAALRRAAPDITSWTLGQGETAYGAPDGGFDAVEIAPDVDRGDPCEAFR